MYQRSVELVYGPNGAGKSYYAEQIAREYSRVIILDAGFGEFKAETFPDYSSLLSRLEKCFPARRLAMGGNLNRIPFRISYTPSPSEYGLLIDTASEVGNVLLVLDEADRFDSSIPEFDDIIARGRHDAVSILAVGLQPVALDKNLRRQATRVFSFGLTDPDDLAAMASIVGPLIYDVPPPGDPPRPPCPYLYWRRGIGAKILGLKNKPLTNPDKTSTLSGEVSKSQEKSETSEE